MLGAIASKAFIELLFLLLLFLLVPWLQSYIHLIISSSSLPQVLLFSLHDFAEREAFRNTHIYIYSRTAYPLKEDISIQQFSNSSMHMRITWAAHSKMQILRLCPQSLITYVGQSKEATGYESTRCLQDLLPAATRQQEGPDSGAQCILPPEKAALSGSHLDVRVFSLAFPLTLMVMCPWTFSISPSMADIKEDFPEPTVPTTATNWPGIMSRFTLKEKSVFEGDEGRYSGGAQATSQTL